MLDSKDASSWHADWKATYQHAYSMVGNAADAEDITQETFVRLFERAEHRPRIEVYLKWMRVVVRTVISRHFAKTRPDLHVSVGDDDNDTSTPLELVDPTRSVEQKVVQESLAREALDILGKLSHVEKECVMMYANGYTFVQIATALEIPYWEAISTTKKAVVAIRKKINR